MADRRLLQVFKLGQIQVLSGSLPLAALAEAPLPKNKAHPADSLRLPGPKPLPLKVAAQRSGEKLTCSPRGYPPGGPRLRQPRAAPPRPSGGRYVTDPGPTPEPLQLVGSRRMTQSSLGP